MLRSSTAVPAQAGTYSSTASKTAGWAAIIVAISAMSITGAAAQIPTPNDNQPLQIQADSGIEWQQDAHLYLARGNAVAIRGTSEVHADTLIAHYREVKGGNTPSNTGGNTEVYRVEAEGHVLMKRDAQNVVGDRAIYDVDRAIAVVTGKGLKLTTPTDTVTARDSLEWYDQKQVAVARGDAVAIRNGKTIKADILTAYMVKTPATTPTGGPGARPGPAPAKPPVTPAAAPGGKTGGPSGAAAENSKISRVDAQGHVVITNALDIGRGDFGVYNAESGIATLIGNVVIERGKDVIRGQRGVMDLNKNISRMMPGGAPGEGHQRVQGLFVREDRTAHPAASADAPHGNPASAGDRKP
jgi:lipopolysaccharide export system protein LptA